MEIFAGQRQRRLRHEGVGERLLDLSHGLAAYVIQLGGGHPDGGSGGIKSTPALAAELDGLFECPEVLRIDGGAAELIAAVGRGGIGAQPGRDLLRLRGAILVLLGAHGGILPERQRDGVVERQAGGGRLRLREGRRHEKYRHHVSEPDHELSL